MLGLLLVSTMKKLKILDQQICLHLSPSSRLRCQREVVGLSLGLPTNTSISSANIRQPVR